MCVFPGSNASTWSAKSGQSMQPGRHGPARRALRCAGYSAAYTSCHCTRAWSIGAVAGSVAGTLPLYLSLKPATPPRFFNRLASNRGTVSLAHRWDPHSRRTSRTAAGALCAEP